jgi:thiol-disulfide isomerase/thioredoxin
LIKKLLSILIFLSVCSCCLQGQSDQQFAQTIMTFDHRLKHPTDEDLGFDVSDVSLYTDDKRMEAFYEKVIKEKKAYIVSQIGKVNPDLIFQQLIYSNFSEKEIYELREQFPEDTYYSPFGKQVKDMVQYYEMKKEAVSRVFPQLSMIDDQEIYYSFPYLGSDRYILLHFWSSICTSCRQKNRHFSDLHDAYNRAGIVVISICVDYFPDNWKEVLKEEEYVNPHYYIPRTEFMNLSESLTLELSTTLLLNADLRILARDIFKLDPLLETIIFR